MSLKQIYSDFPTPPHMPAAKGQEILNKRIRPLLSGSTSYLKISSFFNPHTIISIFSELSQCFKAKGNVKLIIGIHDADKLIPTLDAIDLNNTEEKFKFAVGKIISQEIESCESLISDVNNFVYVLSELIKQEMVEIKIASTKSDYDFYLSNKTWPIDDNIFHPKISIFKDADESVVMTGSINSTKSGYGKNIEEANFRNSWEDLESTDQYNHTFWDIWNGTDRDSQTFPFDQDLKKLIKVVIENSETYKAQYKRIITPFFRYNDFLDVINGPLLFHQSFKKVRLLPHQIAVYKNILSRRPVKGLIADEVGLGKTIEAAAILKYMAAFMNSRKNCLLVPSSLKYQWQNELYELFDQEFFVYENSSSSLVFKPKKIVIDDVDWYDCFENKNNIIFSWHFVRNKDYSKFTTNIDTLLVDEAHNARITYKNNDQSPTLLYNFINGLKDRVSNLLLLTATPLQTSKLDYVSLMSLLNGSVIDEKSINRIIELNHGHPLADHDKVDAVKEMQKAGVPKYQNLINPFDMLDVYNEDDYIMNHPTTLYTIRNTRDSLKAIGYYDFPEVELYSESIMCTPRQERLQNLVKNYAENQLFRIESISLGLTSIGFIKSMYQQRIVSSFKASFDTMTNRKLRLKKYIKDGFIELQVNSEGDMDEFDDVVLGHERIELNEEHSAHIQSELDAIREILNALNDVIIHKITDDPKITRALEIIEEHKSENRSILLFSRYTSTTNYIVELLKERNETFGVFQGDRKQVISGNATEVDYDKIQLSEKFKNREFSVLICSDAASEGLNLQVANVLINIDVPWNPARLLQRFGRIDRFGQKSPVIFFYNLVYLNSVEHRMYQRLIGRNNLFRSILGVTPDITDEAHVNNINELLGSEEEITFNKEAQYRNSLLDLSRESNIRIHENILSRIAQNPQFQRQENELRLGSVSYKFSESILDDHYLDLHHPILKELDPQLNGIKKSMISLRNSNDDLILFCIKHEHQIYPVYKIEDYLDYFIVNKPFNLNNLKGYSMNELDDMIIEVLSAGGFVNNNKILLNGNQDADIMYDDLNIHETNLSAYCEL
jgi:SNF2 family DNA or RNA helicase